MKKLELPELSDEDFAELKYNISIASDPQNRSNAIIIYNKTDINDDFNLQEFKIGDFSSQAQLPWCRTSRYKNLPYIFIQTIDPALLLPVKEKILTFASSEQPIENIEPVPFPMLNESGVTQEDFQDNTDRALQKEKIDLNQGEKTLEQGITSNQVEGTLEQGMRSDQVEDVMQRSEAFQDEDFLELQEAIQHQNLLEAPENIQDQDFLE